jgi:hypothetical protein
VSRMAVRQIEVIWEPPSGVQTASVLHFWDGVNVLQQRQRLNSFLQSIMQYFSDSVTWVIATDGKVLDEATGQMTGLWTEATPFVGQGGATVEPVADATQLLVRWNTNTIRAGRFVLGRTFLPGLAIDSLADGNVAPAVIGPISTAASSFAGANSGFSVYSRPRPGTPGALVTINSSGVSPELAVLRRRRNRA